MNNESCRCVHLDSDDGALGGKSVLEFMPSLRTLVGGAAGAGKKEEL